jgi:hypothetical protein
MSYADAAMMANNARRQTMKVNDGVNEKRLSLKIGMHIG